MSYNDFIKFTRLTKSYTSDGVGRVHLSDIPSTATNCTCNIINTGEGTQYSCSSPYKDSNMWFIDLTKITNASLSQYVMCTYPNTTVTVNIIYC